MKNLIPLITILFSFSLITGCSKPIEKKNILQPLTSAEQKLINICKDEHKMNVIVTPIQDTLWIYLPMKESFLQIKATDEGPKISHEAKETHTIHFIDGAFENEIFNIQYDISLSKNYGKTFGYTSAYTEEYQKKQRNLLMAIFRAYGDVGRPLNHEKYQKDMINEMALDEHMKKGREITSADLRKTKKAPQFVIIVIADIIKGMETKMFIAFKDLKRVMEDPSFYEEYVRRSIIDYPIGHTNIIDDEKGSHLEAYAMSWGEFLMKQMIYRINFKYTRSAFPPSENTLHQILELTAETVNAYKFKTFTGIQLYDLREDSIKTIPKDDLLKKYAPKKKPSKGRLHTIRFRP